ncbi:FAD/NAD(P)-binding protein, partial [Escherichia coli]|nr:FAD/NAD(P)-binding protein [Escherichia coli]
SAFPDEPDHFVRWLADRGIGDAAGVFVPRVTYGAYLRDLLDAARARAGERLTVIRGDVCDVVEQGDGACLCLDNGSRIGADAAVLA